MADRCTFFAVLGPRSPSIALDRPRSADRAARAARRGYCTYRPRPIGPGPRPHPPFLGPRGGNCAVCIVGSLTSVPSIFIWYEAHPHLPRNPRSENRPKICRIFFHLGLLTACDYYAISYPRTKVHGPRSMFQLPSASVEAPRGSDLGSRHSSPVHLWTNCPGPVPGLFFFLVLGP